MCRLGFRILTFGSVDFEPMVKESGFQFPWPPSYQLSEQAHKPLKDGLPFALWHKLGHAEKALQELGVKVSAKL